MEAKEQYRNETGNNWLNSDEEICLHYVIWLENKLASLRSVSETKEVNVVGCYKLSTKDPKIGDLVYSMVSKKVVIFDDPRKFSESTYFLIEESQYGIPVSEVGQMEENKIFGSGECLTCKEKYVDCICHIDFSPKTDIEAVKDAVAKEEGFANWKELHYKLSGSAQTLLIDKIAIRYANSLLPVPNTKTVEGEEQQAKEAIPKEEIENALRIAYNYGFINRGSFREKDKEESSSPVVIPKILSTLSSLRSNTEKKDCWICGNNYSSKICNECDTRVRSNEPEREGVKWIALDNKTGTGSLKTHGFIKNACQKPYTGEPYIGNISLCGKVCADTGDEIPAEWNELEGKNTPDNHSCKACLKMYNTQPSPPLKALIEEEKEMIEEFRKEQPELYDEDGRRYRATPISHRTAELMLKIINALTDDKRDTEQRP